ncbi:hypothetical protein T12_112 [Trichinella patagoniensis]|uniref:Uncharacterized protein n=1 Tax=Trichinella patagoniensis TaxID=990121 RepID=A0A0V0YIV6_9BILA|nr:hypothetical protein T12_112 [Trichinella patagoniensis]
MKTNRGPISERSTAAIFPERCFRVRLAPREKSRPRLVHIPFLPSPCLQRALLQCTTKRE